MEIRYPKRLRDDIAFKTIFALGKVLWKALHLIEKLLNPFDIIIREERKPFKWFSQHVNFMVQFGFGFDCLVLDSSNSVFRLSKDYTNTVTHYKP